MTRKVFIAILLCASAGFVANVSAMTVAVIVNKANTTPITKALVTKIYTGELSKWPGGQPITKLNLPKNSQQRKVFSNAILGKSVSQLKVIWARKMFSGSGVPPAKVNSDQVVKAIVGANKFAIGYINAADLGNTVKAAIKAK